MGLNKIGTVTLRSHNIRQGTGFVALRTDGTYIQATKVNSHASNEHVFDLHATPSLNHATLFSEDTKFGEGFVEAVIMLYSHEESTRTVTIQLNNTYTVKSGD